jgi:photosystem II stability/assembly factor-like uncharacterized protein
MSVRMKSFILGLLLASGAASAAFCQESTWQKVVEYQGRSTNIAGFSSETHGIIAGFMGKVAVTNDSGKTWKIAFNLSNCRFGLDVLDDNVAVNAGNGTRVNVTTDGGRNWSSLGDFEMCLPDNCMFLSFLDVKTGWAGSTTVLASTDNGGADWSKIPQPEGMGQIAAIDLLQPKTGFLLDSNGCLYSTSDGGALWSAKPVAVQGSRFAFTPGLCAANAMQFKNAKEGVLIAYRSEPKKAWVALRTEDGGDSWSVEEITDAMDPASAVTVSHDARFVTLYYAKVISVFKRGS